MCLLYVFWVQFAGVIEMTQILLYVSCVVCWCAVVCACLCLVLSLVDAFDGHY